MMNEILNKYFRLFFPPDLQENEYIRLVAMRNGDNGRQQTIQKFVKNYTKYEEFVKSRKNNFNIYNSLATTKGAINGTKEKLLRQKVVCLDFDAKDYPGLSSTEDYINRIKSILPKLFNHAIVGSGSGGVHVYIAIETTSDIQRVNNITRELGEILGADSKAVLATQIIRVPTSHNLKHENPPVVKLHYCTVDDPTHRAYTAKELERITRNYKEQVNRSKISPKAVASQMSDIPTPSKVVCETSYPCVQRISEISSILVSSTTDQPCLCYNTLKRSICRLDGSFIESDESGKKRRIKRVRSVGNNLVISTKASKLLIDRRIHQTDFLVFICLVRNLRDKKSVTYDDLAHHLGMSVSNISTSIMNLERSGAIAVEKVNTAKGYKTNKYTLLV